MAFCLYVALNCRTLLHHVILSNTAELRVITLIMQTCLERACQYTEWGSTEVIF